MQQSPKVFGWKWPVFFIVVAAELYTMYRFMLAYNSLILLALILASIVLGIILMRWEGSICWKRILYMERHNISSTDEMRDGVLILFAGILMIIPGLITDVIGLFLFLPPIRWIVRKLFLQNLYFEIPAGMESQFRMHMFTTASSDDHSQNDSNYNSENSSQDYYSESSERQSNQKPDVQIIDITATDPNKSAASESENKGKKELPDNKQG